MVAGEPRESRPNPDPTAATNDALERAVAAERDYVDGQLEVLQERLRGIDIATKLLNEGVDRVPMAVTKEVRHLRELTEETLRSVQTQFKERDTRSEREARDNKLAVDAAFAAQEKQAVAQNESNALAIAKSENATSETIKTNQELSRSTTDTLTKGLDEVKLAISRIESGTQGRQAGIGMSANVSAFLVGTLLTVVGLVVAVYLATQ